jgi:hypothetical protein
VVLMAVMTGFASSLLLTQTVVELKTTMPSGCPGMLKVYSTLPFSSYSITSACEEVTPGINVPSGLTWGS